jgi:hypothetical protein
MLMVNVVFILLLMTLAITAFRVGNYLPEGIDILFIVGKEPNMDTTDGKGNVWQSNEKIPLFSSEYVNGENRVIIASQNGDKVIAPGFESSYEFALYNNGNMAVVHETDLDFKLKVANSELENYTFPLKVRLYDTEGNYIIGSKTEWIPGEDASIAFHPGTLGATSYKKYTLELKWEFEGGQDELDTLYGNHLNQCLRFDLLIVRERACRPLQTVDLNSTVSRNVVDTLDHTALGADDRINIEFFFFLR